MVECANGDWQTIGFENLIQEKIEHVPAFNFFFVFPDEGRARRQFASYCSLQPEEFVVVHGNACHGITQVPGTFDVRRQTGRVKPHEMGRAPQAKGASNRPQCDGVRLPSEALLYDSCRVMRGVGHLRLGGALRNATSVTRFEVPTRGHGFFLCDGALLTIAVSKIMATLPPFAS